MLEAILMRVDVLEMRFSSGIRLIWLKTLLEVFLMNSPFIEVASVYESQSYSLDRMKLSPETVQIDVWKGDSIDRSWRFEVLGTCKPSSGESQCCTMK